MTPKALVIDDDPAIIESVSDILDSLGHAHDHADSVEAARKFIERNEYSYYLVDLEIPVRAGRSLPRIQNGENLLTEIIKRSPLNRKPVVIVMTAHGTGSYELAVEVMQLGALDFVGKPFKTHGGTLDKSIQKALARANKTEEGIEQVAAMLPTEKAFAGGEIVYYRDCVRLCGAVICSGPRCDKSRKVLDAFRQKGSDGEFLTYSRKKLATVVGQQEGDQGIPGLIRDLRTRISNELQSKKGIACGRHDVIVRDKQGYHFKEWITVQESTDHQKPRRGSATDADGGTDGRGTDGTDFRGTDGTDTGNDDGTDDQAFARRNWILRELGMGRRLRIPDIMKGCGCSRRTAMRDVKALKSEGIIEFVGKARSGYYRLKKGAKPR